ncbi:MAG: twin-arginine translocation signal domain-containing protein [Dehalococcoidia bacterium]|nr:twin-arginine translocation signal domain-containing protein [Dehalococcoidia bacterium]
MSKTQSWLPAYDARGITRRKFLAGAAAGAGAAALIACGGSDNGGGLKFDDAASARQPGTVWRAENDWRLADETKEAVKGGVYPGVINADQAGSYDALVPAPSQVPFSKHVHEYLMARTRGPGIEPGSPESNIPTPVLAQSMEVAPDGLTVTFTLRQNVKWQPIAPVNGRVMDIDDWRSTLERFLAVSAQRAVLRDMLESAQYPDASHMVWKLKFPYSPLVDRIWSERVAFQILPKELNRDQSLAESVSVGTGYKILDKHQRSVTMEYRKHSEYWGGDPFIDRWHFPVITDPSNRLAQFVTGNIISLAPGSREVLGLARDVPDAVIVAAPVPDDHVSWLSFGREDIDESPWKDARVRIAMRRAVDWKAIGEFMANKQQFEAAGIPVDVVARTLLPRNPTWHLDPEKGELGKVSENYLHDMNAAKQLISAAGARTPIDINHYARYVADGSIIDLDQLMADAMQKSGLFNPKVVISPNTVVQRNCRSLRQCSGYSETAINEDVDYWLAEYSSAGARPGGEPPWSDPRADNIKDAYRREQDQEKRIGLLKELQTVLAEFMPAIPTVDMFNDFTFRWPWMHNTNWGHENQDGRPIWGGHKQWLDADMPRRNG